MLEQVKCPNCGALLKVAHTHLGGKVLCPGCQSIVVISGTSDFSELHRSTATAGLKGDSRNVGEPRRRRVMVSSAFGFLIIVAAATLSGWYSLFLSKQQHFRKTYYEPAIELLTRVGEAVENIDEYSLDDLFAEGVNETRRGIMLSTAAELRDIEFAGNPRIVSLERDPRTAQETVRMEVAATDKEFGRQRIVTLCVERTDGPFRLADLAVNGPGEEP